MGLAEELDLMLNMGVFQITQVLQAALIILMTCDYFLSTLGSQL